MLRLILRSNKCYPAFFRLFVYGFLFFLCACQPSGQKKIDRAFYYWKTTFSLNNREIEILQKLHVRKLYVRYFDVDWNDIRKEPQPVAPLTFKTPAPERVIIIPTVYITNKTLQQISENLIPRLATKILNQIGQLNKAGNVNQVREVQLDCDWTESTRQKYFKLVSVLKEKLKKQQVILSVTIRLHQVKYARRTGIPPADRGMLMFYNMGKLTGDSASNSIYEPATANRYLQNFERYPLPLDVALPAFSWAVVSRNGKPAALLNNIRRQELQQNGAFKFRGNNRFEVQQLLFLQSRYLYPGDVLKMEEITPEQTQAAARQIQLYLKTDTLAAALFHLDSQNLEPYTYENLEEIYHSLL